MPTRTVRTVAEVMRTTVVTSQPSDTVASASARMVDEVVGAVIVVDGKRPIGILTERDLARLHATGAAPAVTIVSEWMTESPDSAAPPLSVHESFAALSARPYRHLPTVEGAEPVAAVPPRPLPAPSPSATSGASTPPVPLPMTPRSASG